MDGLLERLGAGGGRVFSVAPADSDGGDGAEGAASGGHLLEHLGWPCTLRTALLVSTLNFWVSERHSRLQKSCKRRSAHKCFTRPVAVLT